MSEVMSAIPRRVTSMKAIHAVFENGVFRPTEPVDLPERTEVEIEARVIPPPTEAEVEIEGPPEPMDEGLARIYAILGERYDSGHADTAERHNEHQP
jgi:predicted DNA-binding antitoxin AbrB/MazE fold protein